MEPQHSDRLSKEADFQNRRVMAKHQGHEEQRDRFYYLTERAVSDYWSHFSTIAGKSILVVGCSEGGVTPLARKGATVIGIDISDAAIEKLNSAIAKEGLELRANARVMDAHNLDLPDQSLDIICCSGVLHHLDTERAVSSWASKLKMGGQVVMLEPMALNPAISLYRKLTPSMRTEDEHPLLPKDIRIMRKYFGSVLVKGYVLTSLLSLVWTFLPNIWSMKERSMRVFEAIDDGLLKVFPSLVYFCWTSVIILSAPGKPDTNNR